MVIGVNFFQILGGVMALSPPLSSLSSPPFPDSLPSPPLPSPSLRSRAPEIQLEGMGRAVSSHSGVWGGAQPKSNLVHFSLKIRHLMATILMIFVRVN